MPAGLEAGGDDGIDAGLLKRRSLIGCCRCANRDDAIRPALVQNLFWRNSDDEERSESSKVGDRCRQSLRRQPTKRTLNDGIVDSEFRRDSVLIPAGRHHADTSKINSSSTGTPSGRLATPYTSRLGFLSFPKTSCSNSEAPSAIFG